MTLTPEDCPTADTVRKLIDFIESRAGGTSLGPPARFCNRSPLAAPGPSSPFGRSKGAGVPLGPMPLSSLPGVPGPTCRRDAARQAHRVPGPS